MAGAEGGHDEQHRNRAPRDHCGDNVVGPGVPVLVEHSTMVGRGRRQRWVDIDWQLMSLAILNESRELPPPQQARMRDSQQIGRLMAAIHGERGATAMATAYRAFGERYFEHSAPVDNGLVEHVLTIA